MDLNLVALVRMTRAAMPHLLDSHGYLVNIGSLAGKTAARYMGAYSATKFAVSAYSQQLRLELGARSPHVLLVSPGPIARDEPRTHSAEKLAGLPPSAASPAAGSKSVCSRATFWPSRSCAPASAGKKSLSCQAARGWCSPSTSFGRAWATGSSAR